MSSDIDGVAKLVIQRREGRAQRVMRFLDGENQIVPIEVMCEVTRRKPVQVHAGLIKASAITMIESCANQDFSFKNAYQVDGSGRVLVSSQWSGEFNARIGLQRLN